MPTGTNGKKRPRGRPARPMPDPIPDTPENVARIVMQAPPKPKDGWDYVKKVGLSDGGDREKAG